MSGERERKKNFWYVRGRKKDNRALNIIKRGWERIAEKIKRMVDELEKKIIKLKAEQKEKKTQKKSSSVCLVCTNQENTFKEENDRLEGELRESEKECAELIREKEKLERIINVRSCPPKQACPSPKVNTIGKKKKEGAYGDIYKKLKENARGASHVISEVHIRPEPRKDVERPYESGSLWPPGDHYRPRRKDVERSYESEPNWPEEELLSRMAQFSCLERPPKTGLLCD